MADGQRLGGIQTASRLPQLHYQGPQVSHSHGRRRRHARTLQRQVAAHLVF